MKMLIFGVNPTCKPLRFPRDKDLFTYVFMRVRYTRRDDSGSPTFPQDTAMLSRHDFMYT